MLSILGSTIQWLSAALDRWLTPSRLKWVAGFLLLVLLFSEGLDTFSGSEFRSIGGSLKAEDFTIFYNAGRLANQGRVLDAYNYREMLISIHQQIGEPLADPAAISTFSTLWPIYLYSPPYTVFFTLLARLPFWGAMAVWLMLGLAAILVAIALLRRSLPYLRRYPYWVAACLALGFWPLDIVFTNGQNSTFTLLAYVAAFYFTHPEYESRYDWLAGLVASLLLWQKPQLVIGLVLIWLITLRWRALAAMAASLIVTAALTLLVLPAATFSTWLGNLLAFTSASGTAPIPDTDVTMHSLLHAALPFARWLVNPLYYAYFVACLLALVLAVRWLERSSIFAAQRHGWLYVLAVLFTVASPNYLLVYDLTLLLLPVLLLFAIFDGQPLIVARLKLLTAFLYIGLIACHFLNLATEVQLSALFVLAYIAYAGYLFVQSIAMAERDAQVTSYLPLNVALRFSINALVPSLASSLRPAVVWP